MRENQFHGQEENVVMELKDENLGDWSSLCDVTEHFSGPYASVCNWKDTNQAFMNMHVAVKGNSN